MKLYLVLLAVCCILHSIECKKKKSLKDDEEGVAVDDGKVKRKVNESPKAIVAIEIVDPDNKSKNSKRTIESSLGYGYQSVLGATHQQPKYQIYKYSQQDIPPYKGQSNFFGGGSKRSRQKYTQTNYQPGTTLYSTLNQHGQLGDLSSQIPHPSQNANNHANVAPIPVIILRVFPNQIADGTHSLHANLPQTHPQAAYLNSIDLQSLLSNYFHGIMMQHYAQPQVEYQPQVQYHQPQPQVQYTSPVTHSRLVHEYHPPPQYVQYQQTEPQHANGLLTHENYPSDTHTKVVFRDQKGRIKQSQREQVVAPPIQTTKTINVHVPPGISEVQVESSTVEIPQQQAEYQYSGQQEEEPAYFYYNSQFDQQNYQQVVEPQQNYQSEVYPDQPKQYESPPAPDYSQYQQPSAEQEPKQYVTPRSEQRVKQKSKLRSKKSNDADTKVDGEKTE